MKTFSLPQTFTALINQPRNLMRYLSSNTTTIGEEKSKNSVCMKVEITCDLKDDAFFTAHTTFEASRNGPSNSGIFKDGVY